MANWKDMQEERANTMKLLTDQKDQREVRDKPEPLSADVRAREVSNKLESRAQKANQGGEPFYLIEHQYIIAHAIREAEAAMWTAALERAAKLTETRIFTYEIHPRHITGRTEFADELAAEIRGLKHDE